MYLLEFLLRIFDIHQFESEFLILYGLCFHELKVY